VEQSLAGGARLEVPAKHHARPHHRRAQAAGELGQRQHHLVSHVVHVVVGSDLDGGLEALGGGGVSGSVHGQGFRITAMIAILIKYNDGRVQVLAELGSEQVSTQVAGGSRCVFARR
jgi:hypothetical protein